MRRRLRFVEAGEHNLLGHCGDGRRRIEDGSIRANVLPNKEEAVEIACAAKEQLVRLVPNGGILVAQERCTRACTLGILAEEM